jgi:hypothetical protein
MDEKKQKDEDEEETEEKGGKEGKNIKRNIFHLHPSFSLSFVAPFSIL